MIRWGIRPVHAGVRWDCVRPVVLSGFHRKKWYRRRESLRPALLCCGCFPVICNRVYHLRWDNRSRSHNRCLRPLLYRSLRREHRNTHHRQYRPSPLPVRGFPEARHVRDLPALLPEAPVALLPESAVVTASVSAVALESVSVGNLVPYFIHCLLAAKISFISALFAKIVNSSGTRNLLLLYLTRKTQLGCVLLHMSGGHFGSEIALKGF